MNVVSFLCPRPDHPRWIDYKPYLRVLEWSARRYNCRHVVLTDDAAYFREEFETFEQQAPKNLMHAISFMPLKWVEESDWQGEDSLFVGADCILAEDPRTAFAGDYDCAFTWRVRDTRWINTGAVWMRESSREKLAGLWRAVLAKTGGDWGNDLDAICQVLAPRPQESGVEERHGMKIMFFPVETHNVKPRGQDDHRPEAKVVHFKGSGSRKQQLVPYARKWMGYPDE